MSAILEGDSVTFREAVAFAYKQLAYLEDDTAKREAWILLTAILQKKPLDLIKNPNAPIAKKTIIQFINALERRSNGEPVYRILGYRPFFGRDFLLSQETLEPRDDTECLIEASLPLLKAIAKQKKKVNFLDFGTGTGIIAVTLLCEIANSYATAIDISKQALETTKQNAQNHKVSARLTPCLSDGFTNVTACFDALISNPPYIPKTDIDKLSPEVKYYDPLRALNGGEDGLKFYRLIAQNAKKCLCEDGFIALEIGCGQGESIKKIFSQYGYRLEQTIFDLQNILRVLIFKINRL